MVELQLEIAAGARLSDLVSERPVPTHGHAIEVRLYAEDPDQGFLPGSGRLEVLRLPATNHQVRLDSGVIEGDTVSVHYDPMISKLVVWGEDRAQAVARMRARGLVERSGSADDRRAAVVTLTAGGRDALEAAAPAHAELVRAVVFDGMSHAQAEALRRWTTTVLGRLG